ncbi:hypothetical protein ACWKSP_41475 [Micromonosporaceae bacterium Da 78-11]
MLSLVVAILAIFIARGSGSPVGAGSPSASSQAPSSPAPRTPSPKLKLNGLPARNEDEAKHPLIEWGGISLAVGEHYDMDEGKKIPGGSGWFSSPYFADFGLENPGTLVIRNGIEANGDESPEFAQCSKHSQREYDDADIALVNAKIHIGKSFCLMTTGRHLAYVRIDERYGSGLSFGIQTWAEKI